MEPRTKKGNTLRFAMLPVSWAVAFGVAFAIVLATASLTGASVQEFMRTRTLWPLVVIIPALCFGKTLGLVCTNVITFVIPPFRRVFDEECRETGRKGFAVATVGLLKVTAICGAITLLGVVVYVRCHI
jgi:hypothetical protein